MVSTSKVLKALATLEGGGFQQPKAIKDFVLNKDREARGVKQVWGCDKCPYEYEAFVRANSMQHECAGLKSKGSRALKILKEY